MLSTMVPPPELTVPNRTARHGLQEREAVGCVFHRYTHIHTCRVVFESMIDAEWKLCLNAKEVGRAVEVSDLGGAWINAQR